MIDNIFVSIEIYRKCNSSILITDISDHLACLTNYELSSPLKPTHVTFCYRQYPENCFGNIKNRLTEVDWEGMLSDDINTSYDNFNTFLTDCFNENCPLKNVTICPDKYIREKWMTRELLQRSVNINKLYKTVQHVNKNSEAYLNYIKQRNEHNKEKRKRKKIYFTQLLTKYKNNSKYIWSVIHQQNGGKQETHIEMPTELLCDGKLIHNKVDMANALNEFFANTGPNTVQSIPQTASLPLHFMNKIPAALLQADVAPALPGEVILVINGLRNTKACGYDGLPVSLLKNTKDEVAIPLALLINKSFQES